MRLNGKRVVGTVLLTGSLSLFLQAEGAEAKTADESDNVENRGIEGRLSAVEDRLSRLEERLDNVLAMLSRLDRPEDPESLRQVSHIAADAGELSSEVTSLGSHDDHAISLSSSASGSSSAAAVPGSPSPSQTVTTTQGTTAAADVSEPRRSPYGGYMEMHVNHDNINPTTLDFHRFVLLYGHEFNDWISFVGELELEHALVAGGEASGELELEQAYLDFLLTPNLSFRAGMMLTPIGIVNERHEPASFNGVERPFVDTFVIPSTWFSNGAGLVGDLGAGFSFKAFAMSSLNAAFFSADEGFREGRQKGFFDNASNVAGVGRIEWAGLPSLNLGATLWMGNSGLDFIDISGRTTVVEFDGQYDWRRLEVRGEFAWTKLEDAAEINRAIQLDSGVNPNIAEEMRGFYLEAGMHLFPREWKHDFVGFYRYDNYDTQFKMPDGFLPLKQFDRSAHILGVTYFPHPDIALKFDYNIMENESSVVRAPNRWNLGIGWWF